MVPEFGKMPHVADIPALVQEHYGASISRTMWTNTICVDFQNSRRYECRLYGPYADVNDSDIRLWVQVRVLEGTATMSVQVQDATDDAWLNSNAYGLEDKPYDKLVWLSPTAKA